ncbi:MAG: hypothetical protein SGJ19_21625 [Planctomycetia bacterium]|nr:hypothetical protein [Planctomycetia bacterium]
MDAVRWMMVLALALFLAEGFALSVFPVQFRELVSQLDARTLQAAGLMETVLAAALMVGVILG